MMKVVSPHYWPAEWERQTATWIAWPHNLDTWPGRFAPIPNAFVAFATELAKVQRVQVLAGPKQIALAKSMLAPIEHVTVHEITTNDVWIRDYGPTFVRRRADNGLVGVDWKFNSWGGKYPPYDDDARAAELICRAVGCSRSMSSLYCEGGALETDGQGTLLTTSDCLMSKTRNPGWSVSMVEDELKRQLGVQKIIWVDGGGLEGDDTDGHIDQLARFVAPGIVVAACSSVADDSNRSGLLENIDILRNSTTAAGDALRVIELPTPPPRYIDGKRVPESYCNFLFANGIVIVPTFNSEATDRDALGILSALMPNHRVIGIDASDLIWGLGAWHCASQQQPG